MASTTHTGYFNRVNLTVLLVALLLSSSLLLPFKDRVTNMASLYLVIKAEALSSIQVFCDAGAGFRENDSTTRVLPPAMAGLVTAQVPFIKPCSTLRIDVDGDLGEFGILEATVFHGAGGATDILKNIVEASHLNNIRPIGSASNNFQVTGGDPWLVVNGDFTTITQPDRQVLKAVLISLSIFSLIFTFLKRCRWARSSLESNGPIILILALALFLRVDYWMMADLPNSADFVNVVWPDERTYFASASDMMKNGYFNHLTSPLSVMVAPGNTSYIALIYSAFHSIDVVRFFNVILSVITIWLVYRLGNILFCNSTALAAALVCSINDQLVTYSASLLTEPLFIFLLLASIYFFTVALTKPHAARVSAFTAATILTVASLTRSILILYPLTLLVFLCSFLWVDKLRYRDKNTPRRSIHWVIVSLLIPIFFVTGLGLKNYYFFGQFTIATGSGAALWLGSRHDTDGDEPPYRGLTYGTVKITSPQFSHLSLEGDIRLLEAAKENIRKDPTNYFLISLKKPWRLLIGNNYSWFFPKSNVLQWYKFSSGSILELFNKISNISLTAFVVIFGLLGALHFIRTPSVALTLVLPVGYLLVLSVPFLANQRYGLPMMPLLTLLAFGVQSSLSKRTFLIGLCAAIIVISVTLAGF